MAFQVFLRFAGLCAHVPNAPLDDGPTKLWVVMPNVEAPDDPTICQHFPALVTTARHIIGSRGSSGTHFQSIRRREVTFEAEGAPHLSVPRGNADTDFRDVPDLTKIFPAAATIHPTFKDDAGSATLVIARIVVERGVLQGRDRSNNFLVTFPEGKEFNTSVTAKKFVHDTIVDLGPLEKLKITLRDLDSASGATETLELGGTTEPCEVLFGNLCSPLWLSELGHLAPYPTGQSEIIDVDFAALYKLSNPQPVGKLPLPTWREATGPDAKCHQAIFQPFIEARPASAPFSGGSRLGSRIGIRLASGATGVSAAPEPYRARTRYHTQDAMDFCGAAVAMMLLEHLPPAGGLDQAALYALGTALTTRKDLFFIDPEGLAGMLNDRLTAAGRSERYEVKLCPSGEAAVRALGASLMRDEPLPAFTLQGAHWVLVDGVEVKNGGTGNRVGHVWVHSPTVDFSNAVIADPTPPHSGADPCGSDPAHGLSEAAYSGRAWSNLLKPSPLFGLQVPIVVATGTTGQLDGFADEDDVRSALPSWVKGRYPRSTVKEGEYVAVAAPLELGGNYDLAPLLANGEQVGWAVAVGGKRRGIGLFGAPQKPTPLAPEATIASARHALAKTTAAESNDLYWTFAQQSTTPFLPYRDVVFADGTKTHVRIDGATFPKLTRPQKIG